MNRRAAPSFTLSTTMPLSALAAATVIAIVVALLSALMMDDASAQVATTAATTATAATGGAAGSTFVGMMQGLVGLVIVLGAIFAAGWLLKKLGPRARSTGVVQVMGGASVGPREKVVVVRFAGQTLLLGVAPGQVSLLHSADAPGLVDDSTPPDPAAPRFVDRLRAARSGA